MKITMHASGYCNDHGFPLCGADWSTRSYVVSGDEAVTCARCKRIQSAMQRDYEERYAEHLRQESLRRNRFKLITSKP